MNNYCSNCGNKIQTGDVFCSKCGLRINQQNIPSNMNDLQKNNHDGFKIASLVLGIITIVGSIIFNFLIIPLAIIGLILGIIYSAKAKKFCAGIILNILGIVIPIVIICLLAGITSSLVNNGTFFDDYENENINDSYLIEIQYYDLMTKLEDEDDFVLLLSQTTCSHCTNYKTKLKRIAEDYKIKVFYIEVNLLSNNEFDVLTSYINFNITPTTVFIKDGAEDSNSSRINGDSSIDSIIVKFKRNGYIK